MRAVVHSSGHLNYAGRTYRVALGKAGVRFRKQEGDLATPAGTMKLRRVLYRPDRIDAPVCAVPVEKLAPADGWCDDPANPDYNRPVQLPFPASAEVLWRNDFIYDIIGVLGWNDDPVRPGLGSAIFLHLARPDYTPTQGCIALEVDDLRTILASGLTEVFVTI
jgi:L,D-peptidoglycan transpeptidase YkuD (ErfK/YbiS/YcfS/YnhG family)